MSPAKKQPAVAEGWSGWDAYAPFYDWENARTLGRRDVSFWQRLATSVQGPVLELGCGTGRVSVPLARAGVVQVLDVHRGEPSDDPRGRQGQYVETWTWS